MVARARKRSTAFGLEVFKRYREDLATEEKALKRRLRGQLIWNSSNLGTFRWKDVLEKENGKA